MILFNPVVWYPVVGVVLLLVAPQLPRMRWKLAMLAAWLLGPMLVFALFDPVFWGGFMLSGVASAGLAWLRVQQRGPALTVREENLRVHKDERMLLQHMLLGAALWLGWLWLWTHNGPMVHRLVMLWPVGILLGLLPLWAKQTETVRGHEEMWDEANWVDGGSQFVQPVDVECPDTIPVWMNRYRPNNKKRGKH